ncbi:ammonia-dependent NAD(+) synthetase [Tumebacillus sp. ITR2]|uniref:NH(3)-dependent NAD(+) synthetase n=1 Tax=Tumebacillus amylolyticus TaxID=2801339 RepID=A0ABS1J9A8_9BACL|nr:ammonia-dependent NAD(+) synthetase [Tumebacillus amylolyticus]MBL0386860.1 ammonia-dependent NAD(+) synthetase [Tumebacillus amylolyticus]
MTTSLQADIIETLGVQPEIDPQAEIRKRVDFLKQYALKTGVRGYVLGLSGGQDSTLSGKLAQLAIHELNAEHGDGEYQFIAMRLPYGVQADEQDAQDAREWIQPTRLVTVNIKPAVDASYEAFQQATGETLSDFLKGNIKARERMKAQYDVGAHTRTLVIGTDHAAEAISGFFTKHGDGAADITPIFGLNKRQGRALLKELGCPEHLYLKKPTADLEENRPSLPDEDALGVTYDQIDDYLEGKTIADDARAIIEKRYLATEHKRRPPVTVFDTWWK